MGTGYGSGPYSAGDLPPPRAPLSSSRKIDGNSKRYVVSAEGGFEAMDDTEQRVLLLVAFAVVKIDIITPQTLKSREQKIREALTILTEGRPPAIKLVTVSATRVASGTVSTVVEFVNLRTNTRHTVEATQ